MKRKNAIQKNVKHGIRGILAVCFLLVPTVVWMRHFHPFVAMKEFLLASCSFLSFGLLATFYVLEGAIVIRKTRLTLAVTLYALYNLLSWLVFPYTDFKDVFFFSSLILLFFTVSPIIDTRSRNRIIHALIIVALISSIYGCFQFFGIDFYRASWSYFGTVEIGDLQGTRIFSLFGHPNLLGGFYVCVLPIIVTFLIKSLREKTYFTSAYLGMVCVLSLLSLVMSRTRGSWVAVACSFGLLLLCFLWRKEIITVVTKYTFTSVILSLLLIIAISGVFVTLKTRTSLLDATSLGIRWEYYQNTVTMIKERPLFGRGIGTFNVHYPLYRDNRVAAQLGEVTAGYRVEHPHNEHLEILSDGGIIGYGLFLWILAEALYRLFQRNALLEVGMAASLLGLLVDGLLSQNLRFIVISSLFWLLIGFANIAYADDQAHSQWRKPFMRSTPAKAVSLALIMLAVIFSLRFSYNVMQADYYLKGGMGAYSANHLQAAIDWFQQVLVLDRSNKRALYYLASAYRLNGRPEKAIEAYTNLLERDPNFLQANFYLGGLYAQQNDAKKARYYFERQIAGDNLHWKAYYNLAIIALHLNDTKQAVRYLEEIEKIHAIRPVDAEVLGQVRMLLTQLRQSET